MLQFSHAFQVSFAIFESFAIVATTRGWLASTIICVSLWDFSFIVPETGKNSNSSAIGCRQRRMPCWYYNYRSAYIESGNNKTQCVIMPSSQDHMDFFW